jgi:hypothetical protein
MTLSQRLRFERSLSQGLTKVSSKFGGTICSLTPSDYWHKNMESNQKVGPPPGIVPCSYSNYLTTLKRGLASYVSVDPLSTTTSPNTNSSSSSSNSSSNNVKAGAGGKAGAMLGETNGGLNDPLSRDSFNTNPANKVSGLSGDWPVGRGVYVSKDGGLVIRYGFEDHISVSYCSVGFVMSDLFNSLRVVREDIYIYIYIYIYIPFIMLIYSNTHENLLK